MKIIKLSLRQPVLVNLVTLMIIVAGLLAWKQIPREIFPTIDRRVITVTTDYLGVAPGEIEELVTIPIERAIATVDGIDRITATSVENRSILTLELEDDIEDTNRVLLDVQTAVARASNLPADAEDPSVQADKINTPMLWLGLGAQIPEPELRQLAVDLKAEIEDIAGVSEVKTFGLRQPQLRVEVDPNRLAARNLTIAEVTDAIRRKHANVPGGRIYGTKGEYLVRTVGQFTGAEAVRAIVVRANPESTVTVGHVAEVKETFEDRQEESRVLGKPAAFFMVYRQTDADAIKVTRAIREHLDKIRHNLPDGTSLAVLWDSSRAVERRQNTLYENGLVGLLLVVILLFIFLDWRMAVMTSLGIPVAFLGAFVLMRVMDVTLNMVSMFALIMVLGMLVDDGVIVVENFYRHLMMGKSRLVAALVGTSQVVWPVLAAVLTTLAAYLVLVRLPGPMGKVMAILPLVVGSALLFSLVEVLFILPSHLYEFSRTPPNVEEPDEVERARLLSPTGEIDPESQAETEGEGHEARWFLHFQAGFRWFLEKLTRYWYVSLTVMVVGFSLLAVWAGRGNRFVPFPVTTIERFNIAIELPVGTKLQRTGKLLERVERKLSTYPKHSVESYICRVGMLSLGQDRIKVGTHLGTCTVLMGDDGKGPLGALDVLQTLRPTAASIKGVERVHVTFERAGPPSGNPIEIQVRGDDIDRIMSMVERIIGVARQIEGVFDLTHDLDEGKRELHVVVDEQAAARYGLDVTAVGIAVRNAFSGGVAAKLQRGEDEVDVVVRLPDRLRHRHADIEALQIASPTGKPVPFKAVARLVDKTGPTSLVRVDRKRTVTVLGQVDDRVITAQAANDRIRAAIADERASLEGVTVKFSGEQERSQELTGGLQEAGVLALLAIYLILGTVFRSLTQPLVIMLGSIPFALVGVLVGLKIHAMPISIIGILGFVALMGIVVNDSLVLVDFVNRARSSGMGLREAVLDAGAKRLRPVLLTSSTTIAGLLPIAGGWFGSEEFLQPMAVSIVWGLVFSTVLILLMVPCIVLFNEAIWKLLTWPFRTLRDLLSPGGRR